MAEEPTEHTDSAIRGFQRYTGIERLWIEAKIDVQHKKMPKETQKASQFNIIL